VAGAFYLSPARSSVIKPSRLIPQSTGSSSDPILFGAIVGDVIQLRRQRQKLERPHAQLPWR
jgi:hypothetical protein